MIAAETKAIRTVKKYTDKHPGMNHAIELRKHTNKTVKEICQITGAAPHTQNRFRTPFMATKFIFIVLGGH